jgi:preprotein translocase subunit SecA
MRHEVIGDLIARTIPKNAYSEQWNTQELQDEVQRIFGMDLPIVDWGKEEGIADDQIEERLADALDRLMAEKAANFGPQMMRMAEKSLLLQILDQGWKDHLLALDHLRQGIGLRAYGQRDPLNEYKKEAFEMFEAMLGKLRETTVGVLARIEFRAAPSEDDGFDGGGRDLAYAGAEERGGLVSRRPAAASGSLPGQSAPPGWVFNEATGRYVDPQDPDSWGKVARNAPCPCGSGKKYKQCHGVV